MQDEADWSAESYNKLNICYTVGNPCKALNVVYKIWKQTNHFDRRGRSVALELKAEFWVVAFFLKMKAGKEEEKYAYLLSNRLIFEMHNPGDTVA